MADWTCEDDYRWLEAADLSALAWEFLRRNPDYRARWREPGAVAAFGLRFALDPEVSAAGCDPIWLWSFAPAAAVLAAPVPAGAVTPRRLVAAAAFRQAAVEGLHLRFPGGFQALLPPSLRQDEPVGAVLPFGREWLARLAAARALATLAAGGRPRHLGVSGLRRRRLRLALRALDARLAGASYRAVAAQLLGESFEVSFDWRASSARALAIRLCALGRKLSHGGHGALLGRPKG
jgi:hypothetical protein